MTVRVSLHPTLSIGASARIDTLVSGRCASRLSQGDSSLWGAAAQSEAAIRLGWVANPSQMLPLAEDIIALRDEFREQGIERFVLCGMGGSSLAPEVMAAWAGLSLEILDSTHPDHVAAVASSGLQHTAVIVSSKSGTTVETAAARALFADAFAAAGIDPATRIVIVTDPGSPLQDEATQAGYRVFLADPHVGGRYSALTAFGLVPAGLAGVDIRALLSDAHAVWQAMHVDSSDNPAIALAAALSEPTRDIAVVSPSDHLPGFGDWVEQLVAESTGKDGLGILPVVASGAHPPEQALGLSDVVVVNLTGDSTAEGSVGISATLGGAFLLWEYATALAAVLIGVNPFDQPDVESAKKASRSLLSEMPTRPQPDAQTETYQVWSSNPAATLDDAWSALRQALSDSGYLALQVYGNRLALTGLEPIRDQLVKSLGRPVTVGFGPRFLHSTGQFHKGGAADAVFLHIEVAPSQDLDIPGFPYSFATLIDAQSWGDRGVLIERNRPVLTIRVADQEALLSLMGQLLEWCEK